MSQARRRAVRWLAAAALPVAMPAYPRTALRAQSADAAILGRWHGTSICVKADWNRACNDEEIIYRVARSAHSGVITLQASKLIHGVEEPMYDLDIRYDQSTREWAADFSNPQVRIRWSYRVAGGSLTGKVLDLPGERKARDVRAVRAAP